MAMIPQISSIAVNNIEVKAYPSHTYKLGTYRIAGYADGEEAMKQVIYHILSTERYAYPIYDSNYGVELEQYISKPFEYIQASIGGSIKEALLQDDRIDEVVINSVTQSERLDAVLVNFTVTSKVGTFGIEAGVDVG